MMKSLQISDNLLPYLHSAELQSPKTRNDIKNKYNAIIMHLMQITSPINPKMCSGLDIPLQIGDPMVAPPGQYV